MNIFVHNSTRGFIFLSITNENITVQLSGVRYWQPTDGASLCYAFFSSFYKNVTPPQWKHTGATVARTWTLRARVLATAAHEYRI